MGMDVAKIADKTHDAARTLDAAEMAAQQAARLGTDLHSQLDDFARANLSDAFESGFAGANRAAGSPDMVWTSVPGIWGDVTTAGSWNAHLNQYWGMGDSIAIIYSRGEGVTNLRRLSSWAGLGFTGLQQIWDFGRDRSNCPQ